MVKSMAACIFAFFLCVAPMQGQEKAPSPRYAVIDFNATWCGPCRQLDIVMRSKEVESAMSEKSIDFYSIDIDKEPVYSRMYGARTIPCVVMVKVTPQGTTEIKRFIGVRSKEQVLKWLQSK